MSDPIVVSVEDTDESKIQKLSWNNVSYSVKVGKQDKVLISGMRGEINAGEVVGIMGGSGAGKSTLLNTIAGRIGPGTLTGDILVDGHSREANQWKMQYAYVEQDDVMFSNLTVYETLLYAAKLRLPSTMSMEEKIRRVEKQILSLGLSKCRDTIIGDTMTRGISGGERKRVAIGVEMVSDPQVIFLDEPTSGLDAFNALNVIDTIKTQAKNEGKIVMMTIHQPRTDILEMFDKIVLLSAGRPVWFGTVLGALDHFAKLGFELPPKTNPSDHFLDIISADMRSPELKEKSMLRIETFWKAFDDLKIQIDPPVDSIVPKRWFQCLGDWPSSWINEFYTLLHRNLKDLSRDKLFIGTKLGRDLFLALLIGFIFWQLPQDKAGIQSRVGLFFFTTVNQAFAIVMPQVITFPSLRKILKRERAAGSYRSTSAFLAKAISVLPLEIIGTSITSAILYFMCGLDLSVEKFFNWYAILLANALVSAALGLMIGSAVPTMEMAQIFGPVTITILLLFGGLLVNLDTIPVALRWIQWVSFPAYTNKALNQNEFTGMMSGINGQMVLESYSFTTPSMLNCILINIGLSISSLIIGAIFFHKTSAPLQKLK